MLSILPPTPCSFPPFSSLCASCSDSLLCSLIVFGLQTVDIKLRQEEGRQAGREEGMAAVKEIDREQPREVPKGAVKKVPSAAA